jgi:hypothetical protein
MKSYNKYYHSLIYNQLHSQTDLFYGKHPPSTQWIDGLVGSTVGLDSVENRKNFILPGIELGSSSSSERWRLEFSAPMRARIIYLFFGY